MLHMLLKAIATERYHKRVAMFVIVLPRKETRQKHMNYNAIDNINGYWSLKHTSILLIKLDFRVRRPS